MAIKLSGSVSRKVPIPGLDYSSQSYSAGMEIEINSANAVEVQAQLAQLYDSLSRGIDAQIATATPPTAAPVQHNGNGHGYVQSPVASQATPQAGQQHNGYVNGRNRLPAANGNGNGSGRRVSASAAQCRAIFAICKSQGLDISSVLLPYQVNKPEELFIRDASALIDQLKNGNGAAAR
jgi:hypothetical protein